MVAPRPVYATSFCVATSLLGDGALYVVLPVVFSSRGLTAMEVGIILSANRWARLFTNGPAAQVLGAWPVRETFAAALLIGGACSFVYAASTSIVLLVTARCVWGGCWSIIRMTGLLTVTDCVDAELASATIVGRMTGTYAGLSRLGSGFGMALGGLLCDHIGFPALFYVAGCLTMLASPYALFGTFGELPRVSSTAARRLDKIRRDQAASSHLRCAAWRALRLTRTQWQLFSLAFCASCAGNGMIVSTLGAVLSSYSIASPQSGKSHLVLTDDLSIDTATLTGLLLGTRWALEGLGAPFIGRQIDKYSWRLLAPLAFTLSSLNGAIGFLVLHSAEGSASGPLILTMLPVVILFFALVATADLCVKAMGVTWREAPLLVQGEDLGAAVGPVLGYALLQAGLPASAVLAAQSITHGAAALVARAAARRAATIELPTVAADPDGEDIATAAAQQRVALQTAPPSHEGKGAEPDSI